MSGILILTPSTNTAAADLETPAPARETPITAVAAVAAPETPPAAPKTPIAAVADPAPPAASQDLAKVRQRSAKRVASDEKAAKRAQKALEVERLKECAKSALRASEAARKGDKDCKDALEARSQTYPCLLDAFTADKTSLPLVGLLKLATNDTATSEVRAECAKLILQRDEDARAEITGLKRANNDLSAKTAKGDAEIAKLAQQVADQADSFFGIPSQESSSKKKPKATLATAPPLSEKSVATSTDAPSATAPPLPKKSVSFATSTDAPSATAPALAKKSVATSTDAPSATAPALAKKSVAASTGAPSATAPALNEEKKVLQANFITSMSSAVQTKSNARQELQRKATQLAEDITHAYDASCQYKPTDLSPEACRLRKDLADMQGTFLKIKLEIDANEKGTVVMERLLKCVLTSLNRADICTALTNFTDLEKLVGTPTALPASILAADIVKNPTPSEAVNMKAPRPQQPAGASSATCNPKEPWSEMVAHATLPQAITTDTRGVKVVFSIPSKNAPIADLGCKAEGDFTKDVGVPVTSIMRGFLTKMATVHTLLHKALLDCKIINEGCHTGVGSPTNINWKLPACYVLNETKLVIVACALLPVRGNRG
jgi:hypothetical protein